MLPHCHIECVHIAFMLDSISIPNCDRILHFIAIDTHSGMHLILSDSFWARFCVSAFSMLMLQAYRSQRLFPIDKKMITSQVFCGLRWLFCIFQSEWILLKLVNITFSLPHHYQCYCAVWNSFASIYCWVRSPLTKYSFQSRFETHKHSTCGYIIQWKW